MAENSILCTAVYDDVNAALADLEAVHQLHKDELIGNYDAAVVEKRDGKPHIVKRVDHPAIRRIPEAFGSGALPRKELQDAADEMASGEARLIVVGEATVAQGLEKAVTRAAEVAKRSFDGAVDDLSGELSEALKRTSQTA